MIHNRKIIAYFKPKFLLGLTATPERTDGRSIYELCDYNVPYEINLCQAINRGILVPFHYYGIYDRTDYSGLRFVKGDYLESELNATYLNNAVRDNLIYKHYLKYRSERALGFCCSRLHAEYMAKIFSKKGIPSVAVYSNSDGEYSENRSSAIKMLEEGKIKVIFSVDMFNEGVDIPEVDAVMFLRPTQSGIVFLQQLGRGLRTSKGKEYLNVLDFIGNYKYAGKNISLLSDYLKMTDKTHLDNIKKNPVNFLRQSASDFFVRGEKSSIALSDSLKQFLGNETFAAHFKDIIDYRTIDYYSRRYREANEPQVEYKMREEPVLMVAANDDYSL